MQLSTNNIKPANQFDTDFASLMTAYPFAEWSTTEDGDRLHPVLRELWEQAKRKFWMRGHRHANALLFAIYEMSLCTSFRRDGVQ